MYEVIDFSAEVSYYKKRRVTSEKFNKIAGSPHSF